MKRSAALLFTLAALPAAAAGPLEHFENRVRPIFAEHCSACHTQTKMGGLELVSREALLRGGDSGPAVEPKAPERSLLISAVRHEHDRIKMPPAGKLSDDEIAALIQWVDDGAVWPPSADVQAGADGDAFVITGEHRRYWAFRPVQNPVPPPVEGAFTPVDRFIAAKLQEKGLEPAPMAGKRTLLRRAYFNLTGLPPTPEETAAFLADDSPDAFAKVVDRLLASPRYGERWGRHWLDVARYADDRLNSTDDEPFPNAFRYRDWVIRAFNDDMPYDLFVKAQIAGDQIPAGQLNGYSRDEISAGLALFGLSPKFQDDRVDLVGKAFLGMTLGCAQCHHHKFDPVPTEDYYALLGVFNSTKISEHPLAPKEVVAEYQRRKALADKEKKRLDDFLHAQARQLVDALASQTASYILAAWRVSGPEGAEAAAAARDSGLDEETLVRWVEYLEGTPKEHPLLDRWQELQEARAPAGDVERFANETEELLVHVIAERKRIERENDIRLGGDDSNRALSRTELLSLERDQYFLWRDAASHESRALPSKAPSGVLYYKGEEIERFLDGVWQKHVDESRRRVAQLEAETPEKYPFHHAIADIDEPRNEHVHIRGNRDSLGDEVPRRFLAVLSPGEPRPFKQGSGRLELAEAIVSPENPLTPRVIANRVWLHHFGQGIVGTPSNFGQMGERPTHPELLDYLAARLVESGWSIKALHREILLTDAYARSSRRIAANEQADPANKLLWRANLRRLDVEALRDTMLVVAGDLDETAGGPPRPIADDGNQSRTVYSWVSRRSLDVRFGLFDFPNPNSSSERRVETNTPMQGLYFLNSELTMRQAEALTARVKREAGADPRARVERLYALLFGRAPDERELEVNLEFLAGDPSAWPKLAQALLTSNEFLYVP